MDEGAAATAAVALAAGQLLCLLRLLHNPDARAAGL
jgi:hypothetical protein